MESCFYLAVLCIPMELAPRPLFLGKECVGPRGVPVWDGSSCTFLGRVSPRIFRLTLRVLLLGQTRLLVNVSERTGFQGAWKASSVKDQS